MSDPSLYISPEAVLVALVEALKGESLDVRRRVLNRVQELLQFEVRDDA